MDGIIGNPRDPQRNSEGYSDPTTYKAFCNMDQEEKRFQELLRTLFYMCKLADFEIKGRIVLVDKKNGRVWR